MNVLLDSHVLIWLDSDSKRLSQTAIGYLSDPNKRLLLSAASVWEIAIKIQLGKLQLTDSLENVLHQQAALNTIGPLDIAFTHAIQVGRLPQVHKDPFDRMIVAQAMIENAVILTDDRLIRQYPVRTDW